MTTRFQRTIAPALFVGACATAIGVAVAQPAADSARQPLVLTLDRAITIAVEQNRDVIIADQNRFKADAQVSEARSGALPNLSVSGTYFRNIKKQVLFLPGNTPFNPSSQTLMLELGSDNSYAMGATLAQPLFNWRVGLALDIATTYLDYSEKSYTATVDHVTFGVKKAFYGVLFARELVKANQQGLAIVSANLKNVEAQYRNGTAAEFDLLRAQVQVANTEPLVTSAENNLLLATNALKNILSLPLDTPIVIDGALTYEDVPEEALAEARSQALEMNPQIKALDLQESMMQMNIGIERANNYPSLTLVGSYQWQTQANTFHFKDYLWANSLSVGLQLSFPLFDGFRTSARTDQAQADYQMVHVTRQKAEEGLKIQIQSAELRMAEAKKRLHGQDQNIQQAEKAVRIAQTRYSSGVGTQLELLDAQVAMTRTQTNRAQALYDYLVAKAEWAEAVGMNR